MSDLHSPQSLCSCDSPRFEKRTLYCGEYEDSVMTCSLCLQELSIDEWDQRKSNQESSNTQSRTLKVDIDRAQQATVPIYVRRQSSMERYVTEKILPDVKSRPSPVLSPDVWAWRPPEQKESHDECDMKYMNDILSFAPCNKCFETKTPIYGYRNESPIAWFCSSCNDCTGVDDTFTTQDAFELADLLASSLENGTLQVDPCKGCGENTNPELFGLLEVNGELVMECMCCDHREPLTCLDGDIIGPTEEFGDGDNMKYGLRCDCGNDISEVFQVTCVVKDSYEVTCLNCDRKSHFGVDSSGENYDQEDDYVYDMDPTYTTFSPSSSKSDQTFRPSTAYTKVKNLSDLNPGDHIKFDRDLAFWHHAIVEGVDHKKRKIDMIHYSGRLKGPWGEVMRETIRANFKKDSLHRVDYESCHSWDTVLSRAMSRLGENKYNPFTNNCEHFAQWCKIGMSRSDQVHSFADFAFAAAAKVASFTAKDGTKQIINIVKSAGRTGLRMAADEAASAISTSAKVVTNSAKNVARSFTKLDAAMTGVAIGVELVRTGRDIGGYYKQKKAGNISGREFIRCTLKRVCQGAGGIIGSFAGNMIGNFCIPFYGGIAGTTLGTIIGEFVGKIIGRQVSKVVRD